MGTMRTIVRVIEKKNLLEQIKEIEFKIKTAKRHDRKKLQFELNTLREKLKNV